MKTKSAFDLNNSCDIKSDKGIIKSGETIVLFYVHLKNNHICYEAYGSYLGEGERKEQSCTWITNLYFQISFLTTMIIVQYYRLTSSTFTPHVEGLRNIFLHLYLYKDIFSK